jgi:hypothetical protein
VESVKGVWGSQAIRGLRSIRKWGEKGRGGRVVLGGRV